MERIVGSTERHREFDRLFLPKSAGSQTRWKRIDRAFHRCEDLPPVSLYVVGAEAEDFHGRLRVWVARYHSVEWIDAEVTEFRVPHVPHGEPPNRPQSPFHTYHDRRQEMRRRTYESRSVNYGFIIPKGDPWAHMKTGPDVIAQPPIAILLTSGTARVLMSGDAEAREEYVANGPYTEL